MAFVPGHTFAAGSNRLRLNVSHSTPEMIDETVAWPARAPHIAPS